MRRKICTILATVLAAAYLAGCGTGQETDPADGTAGTPGMNAQTESEVIDTMLPEAPQRIMTIGTASPGQKTTKAPAGTAAKEPEAGQAEKPDITKSEDPAEKEPTPIPIQTQKPAVSNKTEIAASVPQTDPSETAKPSAGTSGKTPAQTPTPVPCAHNYEKRYWPAAPTCAHGGDWYTICLICGEIGGSGTDPALSHTPETRIVRDATYCNEYGVKELYCTSCGFVMGSTGFDGTEHEWTTGTYEAFDYDLGDVVTRERTYCARCGISK